MQPFYRPSYVTSGYAPISARVLQALLFNTALMTEVTKLIGASYSHREQEVEMVESEKRVVVIGVCGRPNLSGGICDPFAAADESRLADPVPHHQHGEGEERDGGTSAAESAAGLTVFLVVCLLDSRGSCVGRQGDTRKVCFCPELR